MEYNTHGRQITAYKILKELNKTEEVNLQLMPSHHKELLSSTVEITK
jgi:hypothetical protein